MITPDKIRWSSYSNYEGPFYHGSQGFKLPSNHDETDRYLAVITAAEGGHYDAINMYDRGIISVGIIQWIEAGQYSVSGMLGKVIDDCGSDAVMVPLKPALELCGATFKKNAKGQWRFFFNDAKGEVDSIDKTRILFLGCTGIKGQWTPEARTRATTWAACVANVWVTPEACRSQNVYTRTRLSGFIMPDAKKILFGSESNAGLVGATRAAYMSFAINLPAYANNNAKIAMETLKSPKWSQNWCIGMLKQLTFGSNIAIYPLRYNGIRPVLESLWSITLPKTAAELKAWIEPEPTIEPLEQVVAAPEQTPEVPEPETPVLPPIDSVITPKLTPGLTEPEPPPAPITPPLPKPQGALGFILWLLQTIFGIIGKKKT